MAKKLQGLIAAPHTPFNADGSVNLEMIPKQIDLLVKQGVIGAYICGTTGEGICCSVAERKAVMKAWADCGKGKLFIIAHVGALSVADARELAACAQELGLDATSIVPPNFFRPGSIDSLISYINSVLVAAPNLGPHSTAEDVLEGMERIKEYLPDREPEFVCVLERLIPEVEGKIAAPIMPIRLNTLPDWLTAGAE